VHTFATHALATHMSAELQSDGKAQLHAHALKLARIHARTRPRANGHKHTNEHKHGTHTHMHAHARAPKAPVEDPAHPLYPLSIP
jgi:hypothetical protein